MREGVDCIAAVTDRHAESVLIKGLRLQRQRAQGPALLCSPQTTKNIKKKGERLHCLLWCLQETEHQSERQKREREKKILGKRKGKRKRQRKFAKSLREKRRLKYGDSRKEDLWFGKGVASA